MATTPRQMHPEEARHFAHFSVHNAVQAQMACPEGSCEAYRDIFTFRRWRAQGYVVRKGEHGTTVTTWIPVKNTTDNGEQGDVRRRPKRAVLFCRHQVERSAHSRRHGRHGISGTGHGTHAGPVPSPSLRPQGGPLMTERYRLTLVREPAGAPFGTQVWQPADIAGIARAIIGDEPQEIVLCLHLDRRHRLRGYHEIARGGIASAQVDMQILFGAVLLTAAPAFAIAHNHPSGETTPSPDDLALTRRVSRAAGLLGVEFIDHLIVTASGHASLREHGAL